MSRRNRPDKTPAESKKPSPFVANGKVFATFIEEGHALGVEVEARRAFDTGVSEYLKEKGLADDFNAWRQKRTAQG